LLFWIFYYTVKHLCADATSNSYPSHIVIHTGVLAILFDL